MLKRILIIDDDPAVLDAMQMVLTYAGFEVKATTHADRIFEQIKEFSPKLIIVDYLLNNTTGAEVCHQIKNMASTSHIPVIIASAFSPASYLLGQCGHDGFIHKPFDLWDTVNKINDVITRFALLTGIYQQRQSLHL